MGIGVIQPMHLLLILVIVLVVFGAGKLSQVGGALGQSVKEFKASVAEGDAGGQDAPAPTTPARAEQAVASDPPVHAEQVMVAAPRPAESLRREEI